MGVFVGVAGLGDGVTIAGVGVGEIDVMVGVACGRRCGLGQTTRTVPQTILTATNRLSTQNKAALLRPFCVRVTTYLLTPISLHMLSALAKRAEQTGRFPKPFPTKAAPFRNRLYRRSTSPIHSNIQ